MKKRFNFLWVLVISVQLSGHSPAATNQYWNVGSTGGDGNWGSSPGDKNWNATFGAPTGNVFWPDTIDDVAVFQDSMGGTVTVFDAVQTSGIVQNGADYTINAGLITLVRDSALTAPFVEVQAGTLTIDSTFEGTEGLNKTGDGSLSLTNENHYTGTTRVTAGSLTLSGTMLSEAVDIAASAAFFDQNGGLPDNTAITNAGELTLNAADTVADYTSNGGTLTAGPGTLSATTASLNDGSAVVGFLQTDSLASNGSVVLSGSAKVTTTDIQSGTFTLDGSLDSSTLDVATGANFLDQNGGLADTTTFTNAGALTLSVSDTVAKYTSNGGTLTAGPGTLFTTSAHLNHGSGIAGLLETGSLTSNGLVVLSGSTRTNSTDIQSGTLTLSGSLISPTVDIATGAALLDQNGGLADHTILTNAGTLTLNVSDKVASYTSNAGKLAAGPGTLTTSAAILNHGSSLAGRLDADVIYFKGATSNSGIATADTVSVASGTLVNTGILGTHSSLLDISTGSALVAAGTQRYSLLTTSGPASGTWHGNLKNPATVAPGGKKDFGKLDVVGNFSNTSNGLLNLDISAKRHDLLRVTGTATFDGTLDLNQLGSKPIASFVPIQVVSAAAYEGNITSLNENLDGAIWFNPGNGTVTRIDPPVADATSLFGATENQSSTWISLYDDVIEPGTANITRRPGATPEYRISSGLADEGNPDLMWALAASITPAGLNADLLNRLSPEVYTSFSDYATQATRTHQRTALSAPALAAPRPKTDAKSTLESAPKASSKDAIPPTPASQDWVLFAATDYFNVETDNSRNLADYQLSGMGLIAGGRTQLRDQIQLAAYLAVDDGSVDGPLIDADGIGWSVGIISETMLDKKSQTRLTAAASYGRYSFDGSRESVSATSAGWMPGDVDFSNVDSDSLELLLGIETLAYQNKWFRLTPSAGLRYASGAVDNFTESTTRAPGSPIALDVERDSYHSLLAEMAILAETDLTEQLTLWGQLGFNAGIGEDPHTITAAFAKGSRPMSAEAEGLTNDLLFIGLGAEYRINESISIGGGYRGEFRSSHHTEHGFSFSSSFRF